jgi:predicted nucleotidyltransferase
LIFDKLYKQGVVHPPKWMPDNLHYLTIMGSQAYGVSEETSDNDVYGFCIPPKDLVFPTLAGEIPGFGTQIQRFEQYQEHHIKAADSKKEYDFSIYSIVKYFDLCMHNNPNMIDSLFTPRRCILHSTAVGELVRENRRKFLHKGSWHKFKGYAYSQMSKIRNKVNAKNEERAKSIQETGYDKKYAYHLIRLINEVEQILVEHDLDIQRNREQLKTIRKGQWTLEQVENYFYDKEKSLETIYASSTLPQYPDEKFIKQLLINCLEMHYGSLAAVVNTGESAEKILRDMQNVIDKYKGE